MFVNLQRAPVGAPMRLDAVNDLVTAAARRAGTGALRPHQLRHSFASNVIDAGGTLEEAQDLLGHVSISSTQVYANSRVLHQPGEKPQVSWSVRAPDGFRSPMADAC